MQEKQFALWGRFKRKCQNAPSLLLYIVGRSGLIVHTYTFAEFCHVEMLVKGQ